MDTLYLVLLITSISMMAILALAFFDVQLKKILAAHLYNRAFTLIAMVTAAGILCALTLGFAPQHKNMQASVVVTVQNKA